MMAQFSGVCGLRWGCWTLLAATVVLASPAGAGTRQTTGFLSQGTRWETPYYVQQSDEPGPTVVIVGGVHGDEPAGAAAAEEIRHWPIVRGKLVVLPRANVPALAAHTRLAPEMAKELSNLNRDFPKAGQPGSAAGEPAGAIWAWVSSLKPTWLLDLHEGTGIRGAGSNSVGSSVIVCHSSEADAAAQLILQAVNATITEESKRFVQLGPPIDGSLARACGERLGTQAMILETSVHDLPPASREPQTKGKPEPQSQSKNQPAAPVKQQPLSKRVRQHRIMVRCLLMHLGMIDPALDVDLLPGRSTEPGKTWVAVYDAYGTGGRGAAAVEQILTSAGMRVFRVGPEEIDAGTLKGFDLVVVPGGSGSKEAAGIGEQGRQQIRQFVESGGAYLGICAGAYLCTSGFDWGLKILNAKTVSPRWNRGIGTVKIELTPAGSKVLGDRAGLLDVHYANGPIITRAGVEGLSDYEVLAFFRTELARNGTPEGVMINSPAIVSAGFGKGRVVFISPHPEQTPGLEDVILRATLWAVGKAKR